MFDNLSDKLQRVFKNLRGEGKLTAENMEAALREIRIALQNAIGRWQRRAENPLSSRDVADASRVLIRTCEGMLVDVSGAAVLKSSKHAADARRFLAYLVSKPAQTIIATSASYEYPLGSGVTTRKDAVR